MLRFPLAHRVSRAEYFLPHRAIVRGITRSAPSLQSSTVSVEQEEYDEERGDGAETEGRQNFRARTALKERSANKGKRVLSFDEWSAKEGQTYKWAKQPRNWLAEATPFPQNPTFQPPTPISDDLKSYIYALFMKDPQTNSIRALAMRYHLSIKRVDAILRLKGLEEHWKKGKVLQRGYMKTMEWHLGVEAEKDELREELMSSTETLLDSPTVHDMWLGERHDVSEADLLDEDIGDDILRARYQRLFYEPVIEGDDPILPEALARARSTREQIISRKEAERAWDPRILKTDRDPLQPDIMASTSGSAAGRPKMKFVDVGAKFADSKDIKRREKESVRRSLIRAQRHRGLHVKPATAESRHTRTWSRVLGAISFKRAERSRRQRITGSLKQPKRAPSTRDTQSEEKRISELLSNSLAEMKKLQRRVADFDAQVQQRKLQHVERLKAVRAIAST